MSRRCGNDNRHWLLRRDSGCDNNSGCQKQMISHSSVLKKLPPRHNTAGAIHIICNQRIALLNNLCRHHCAVSLNGFDNIDS